MTTDPSERDELAELICMWHDGESFDKEEGVCPACSHLADTIVESDWFLEVQVDRWRDGYNAGDEDARAVQGTYPEPTTNPYTRYDVAKLEVDYYEKKPE